MSASSPARVGCVVPRNITWSWSSRWNTRMVVLHLAGEIDLPDGVRRIEIQEYISESMLLHADQAVLEHLVQIAVDRFMHMADLTATLRGQQELFH